MLRDLPRTGIVVPCYNEGARLPVADYERFAARWPQVSFCFVDDGSHDDTGRLIRRTAQDMGGAHCAIALTPNRGKAEAVRAGVQHVTSETDCAFVGYWDADLATPLEEIPRLLDVVALRPNVRFLCGSRVRRMGATIERATYRHVLGRGFATCASLALRLPIYDTQCGAKLLEAALAREIFAAPFISRWIFDVELVARTVASLGREQAVGAIFELPLEAWREQGGSKLSARAYVRAPWELLKVWKSYRTALR
jgi:glycosyltransferase involved in cell wall biosynthesis